MFLGTASCRAVSQVELPIELGWDLPYRTLTNSEWRHRRMGVRPVVQRSRAERGTTQTFG